MKRVAIVGGGPGGLFTAFSLEEKSSEDIHITLFEARNRLGGKVQTARFDAAPILYEAGVAELYRYGDDPLWLLVTRVLGLPVVEMAGNAVVFEGKLLRSDADLAHHFGEETARAVADFRKQAREGRPFSWFYDGGWPGDNRHPWTQRTLRDLLSSVPDGVARRFIEIFIHSDVAAEPHTTSGLYGFDNYLINEADYCQLYSIEGGIERLITALSERIDARIALGARAERVEKTATGTYRIFYERGGQHLSEEFDAVVVALPHDALKRLSFEGERLRNAVERHVGHHEHPAHYLRITALFKEPFWGDTIRGSYFIHDAFGGMCVYDEGTRHPAGDLGVLSWLLGGADAMAMSTLADDDLLQRMIASLPPEITGPASPRDLLVEGHVHRFLGAVNGRPGGAFLRGSKKRHRVEPEEHAGLLLVGDYLFDATTNGAFDSADIASSMLLDHLGVAPKTLDAAHLSEYLGRRQTYEASFELSFDARYVTDMLEVVFGATKPYRLLDAGSANGATLAAFAARGVDAWGVENCWYIHARTPAALREKNLLADVWRMPFPDGHFDFVYETCLSYVPEAWLDVALAELRRVTRRGLMLGSIAFGSMAVGAPRELFGKRGPLRGVQTSLPPEEWSARLLRSGFRPAILDATTLAAAARIEATAPHARPVHPPESAWRAAFWRAQSSEPGASPGDSPGDRGP